MRPEDRVIVALDVPTADEAMRLVDELDDIVSFFKIGLELLVGGGVASLLVQLKSKRVFLDLKLPDDVPTTIQSVVRRASEMGVKFLTLSHSVGAASITAALMGRGSGQFPELLWVPQVSSLDAADFAIKTGRPAHEFHAALLERAKIANALGVDGFVVSGAEIAVLRAAFPRVPLVSPGIRLAGSASDDHKRSCTPAEAIQRGADYLVVGRPIRNAPDRRVAAQRIVDEVAQASR